VPKWLKTANYHQPREKPIPRSLVDGGEVILTKERFNLNISNLLKRPNSIEYRETLSSEPDFYLK